MGKHGETIHLLVTDVVMPGMNGRQLAERLVQTHPETRTLFTSGYTENIIAHHGVLDRGIEFLSKPYTLEDLTLRVRKILDQAR
jgi:YesN/AraC family two-component response regulator